MTIKLFLLKGDLNGENRSGLFLYLLSIHVFIWDSTQNVVTNHISETILNIHSDSPEPLLLSYMKYGSR